ncbi:Metallo-dependent phosphatase [Phlegmacium glaucopus]|nr:Metallo-dependent phosphatase [Phlegmacium glaucopus]
MQSSDKWLRRMLAYTTLSGVIVFIFLYYGVTETLYGMGKGFRPLNPLTQHQDLNAPIPDFSRYKFWRKLSAEDFPIDDPTRRVIITGDLHGMMKPLENLLHDLDYSSTRDVFIHVGDIVTKGPHKDSMTLLTYLASNNITGVRGNNDQKVVEWRGWLNWIASLSGGEGWLKRFEKIAPQVGTDKRKLIEWMEEQRNAAPKNEKKWWNLIPHKWVLFSDHYRVARDMSAAEFQYLLDLPLRLYVPSAHVFIVHAGLLPSDPRYPSYDARRQPLARVPVLEGTDLDASKPNKTSKKVEKLRNLQEIAVLTQIPQNLIPWVLLNMKGVKKNGKISKKTNVGTPWSDLWKQEMDSCVGYDTELVDDAVNGDDKEISGSKQALPCYPSTVVYGHAAARGLDLKRWTIGLDSGCAHGRKLSALVIGGTEDKPRRNVDDYAAIENHGDNSSAMKQSPSFPFSDHARARIRTVKCQR